MVGQSPNPAPEPFFRTSGVDPRADRGRREIAIGAEHVTIQRQLHGIDMRLSLAISAYAGVALCLRPSLNDALIYQVRLVHRDQELSVVLDEAPDDRDILADWRLWARVLGLPALVERELGVFEPATGTLEAATSATVRCARRKRVLKRRPRFLARRKAGLPLTDRTVHAGEREIIARH